MSTNRNDSAKDSRSANFIFYYVTEAYRSYLDDLKELSLETELMIYSITAIT